MTLSDATSSGGCTFAGAYEQLRSGVLEGVSTGGHFGLVILLREGVAAWMEHGAARPTAVTCATATDRPMAAPIVSDEIHTDMVGVLASMAMAAIPTEMCV